MAHFYTEELQSPTVQKRTKQYRQNRYDYSSFCDQTEDDPGLDQAGQAHGRHSAECGQ